MGIDGSNTFNMYENIPLHKRFFIVFFQMFFTLRKKKCYLRTVSLKGSLGNLKWFFYGIVPKKKKKNILEM